MVRHRGASGVGDRRSTCNQLTGTRTDFFSRYLNARPLLPLINLRLFFSLLPQIDGANVTYTEFNSSFLNVYVGINMSF